MHLRLNKVLPVPLLETPRVAQSELWGKNVVFEEGGFVFVQAPSGSGKTTLIHLLYGLRHDFEGEVYWEDKSISKAGEGHWAALRKTSLSIVFQDLRLFPELTAFENIEIKRLLTDTVPAATVDVWLASLGMTEKRNAIAQTLSFGEQQRVAILRALVQPFKWLLMDEPFSHLDSHNRAKAVALIGEVVLQNKACCLLADLDKNNFFPYKQTIQL